MFMAWEILELQVFSQKITDMLYEYTLKSNKFTPGDLCFIRLVSKAIIAVFTIGDEIQ